MPQTKGDTMPQHPVDHVVNSGTVPIAVRDFGGSGLPVILIHGLGGTVLNWTTFAAELTPRLRVIGMDLRGHGDSGDGPWEWDAILDDTRRVADHYELHNPAMVGMSLGGMLAAMWGRHHPDCPGVVNLDGHPFPGRPTQYRGMDPSRLGATLDQIRAQFTAMTAAMAQPLTAALVTTMLDQQRAQARAHGADESIFVDSARRNLTVRDNHTLMRPLPDVLTAARATLDDLDLFSVYRQVQCPLLVVLATENLPGLEGFAELMTAYRNGLNHELTLVANAQHNVRVINFEGTSHAMVAEHPRRLAELVMGFLGQP
jgi:pimeloyl-ACP methyl ester carboxylesterase